jgi:hypothetical protein
VSLSDKGVHFPIGRCRFGISNWSYRAWRLFYLIPKCCPCWASLPYTLLKTTSRWMES